MEEFQVTEAVRLAVCAGPVKFPVAMNCCVSPSAIEGFAGVTAMETNPVALPVPVSPTRVGLPKALWLIVSVPVRVPTTVGVNFTPTVQVSPAPTLEPHVLLATA
jgi:hypothetical protein